MSVTELHPDTIGKYVVVTVDLDDKELKAAALDPDGEKHAKSYHSAELGRANPRRSQAEREVKDGERDHANRSRDLTRCQKQIDNTNPKIFTHTRRRDADRHQTRILTVLATVYLVAAVAALAISNYVGAVFVVASGNDLFAIDAWGARAFFILPVIVALGTAAYEINHRSDRERFLYRTTFLAIGLGGFLIWMAANAVVNAPTGGTTNWASTGTVSMVMGSILLSAHVLVDAAMGSVILSSAVAILTADRIIEPKENPEYVKLCAQRDALEAELKKISASTGLASDYLRSLDDAQNELNAKVHLALRFKATQHASAQQEQAGKATLNYLSA